jgi:hypothetical protein
LRANEALLPLLWVVGRASDEEHAVFAKVFGLLKLENLETACSHADY